MTFDFKKTILLTCYLFFIGVSGFSQKPLSINLQDVIQLPDIRIYDLLEDKNGFIWLAADKGLFRYDGREFIKYENKTKKGLAIFDLNEDKEGRIWCTNISGQIFFARNKELITFLDLGKELNYQIPNISLYNNSIFIFTSRRIFRVNNEKKKIELFFESDSRISEPYINKNELYFNSGSHIYKINGNEETNLIFTNDRLKKEKNEPRDNILIYNDSLKICLKYDKEHRFYLINQNTVKSIATPTEIKNLRVTKLYLINNLYWISTNKGVYAYELIDDKFILRDSYFRDFFISDLLIDRNENYWFSTLGSGIFIIQNIHAQKNNLPKHDENITCLSKISETKLLFGTMQGSLGIYDLKNKETNYVKYAKKSRVNGISPKFNDRFYYIGFDYESYILDIKKKKISRAPITRLSGFKDIEKISDEIFAVGTYSKSFLFDNTNFIETKDLGKTRTKTIYFDKENEVIYIGYIDKLVKFDRNYNEEEILLDKNSILSTSIERTDNDIIWIATTKNGIIGLKNGQVEFRYNIHNGLVSNTILKLKSYKNNLWLVTDVGIQKLNTETNEFHTLLNSDGVPTTNISDVFINEKELIVTSNRGLLTLNKEHVFKKLTIPEVYLSSIEIDGKDVNIQKEYTLSKDKNNISFSFFSNGFNIAKNTIYEYTVKRVNNIGKWQKIPMSSYSVNFNSLSSGNYIFQIRARNNKDLDYSYSNEIKLIILAPIWERTWFLASSALMVLFLLLFIMHKYASNKEKKQIEQFNNLKKEKQLISASLENLRSQMNPHFIFNALTSIQEYILLNKSDQASEYLVKFSRLIRMYLEHSKQETINISNEIEALDLYLDLEQERFKDLQVNLVVDEELKKASYEVPSIFIQPYIENSIKHGLLHKIGKKILDVSIVKKHNNIICIIEDNGIGRQAANIIRKQRDKSHKSFATSANNQRLNLINKSRKLPIVLEIIDLTLNNVASGTKIIITVPVE